MPRRRPRTGPNPSTFIPPIDRADVERIQNFLVEHYDIKRPPEIGAAFLAIVLALYRHGKLEVPTRAVLAKTIGCSKDGLDNAIDRALERELVSFEVDMVPATSSRGGTIQVRRYVPAPELLNLFARRRSA